ncbi:MAG: SUMF1/EgtB/PvdO family nonheme iron enzyme [Chloroflexota bacterium]
MSGLIGQTFGRYEILELLGEGGMATVYKAHDSRLEREVAIKVIRRSAFPPEEMEMLLKRFEREAKALARLSHPNIVGVIDYGEFEGQPYLVMEYLPGGTLKQRMTKPLPWREAVQILLPVARALEYIHAHNIINRDIKPSNILMSEDGQPMLTDFGLVKLFEEKKQEATLTSSGAGIGTPDYMAPEQWTGETSTLSDLYSLGVVLYEMITGHKPYTADTPAGVLLKQATEPLPLPKNYVPNLPHDVESVILKVLAKKPVDRYPDVCTFADELQNLLLGKEVSASTIKTKKLIEQMTGQANGKPAPAPPPDLHPAPAKKTWFALAAALGVVVFLGIAGVVWFLSANPGLFAAPTSTRQPTSSPTETQVPATETVQPTSQPTRTNTPAVPTQTSIPVEIRDSKNAVMRLVPAGEFVMGSDSSGDANARPANTVALEAFYIDKFEVTNEMYDACAYAVECRKPLKPGTATRSSYYSNPVFANYPVLYVDWKMANAYCEWRDARLPTEAEWEKAARGTDERPYPWGSEEPDCSYANLVGCIGDTAPVDQYDKGQSIYGVYGMSGNVWEWTSSLFDFYPYDPTDGREDLDVHGERIVRGGSWHAFAGNTGNVRVDTRLKLDPGYFGAYVGFRCVRDAENP